MVSFVCMFLFVCGQCFLACLFVYVVFGVCLWYVFLMCFVCFDMFFVFVWGGGR